MTKLTRHVIEELVSKNSDYQDLLDLEDEPQKLIATFGREHLFEEVTDLAPASIEEYYANLNIHLYSTPPWVVDGQYGGLTILWKQMALQAKLDENMELLEQNFFPKTAEHFAMRVCHTLVDAEKCPEMYRFIAHCFADFDNPFLK